MSGFIGIDWGTSRLRAWRFGSDGRTTDRRADDAGVALVADGDFEGVLHGFIGDWTDGRTPLVLSGMVGSRNGWREAPYLPCPAALDALAAAAMPLGTKLGPAWIVPGLEHLRPAGTHDVMRGEEVQIVGAGAEDGIVALPGTHSKWAVLRAGRVEAFRTFMTGELFALLKGHSLLGRLFAEGPYDDAAFLKGARRSLDDPALTALLFSVRTEGLFDALPAAALPHYLSGLLIGAEIANAWKGSDEPVTVVAARPLADLYATALREAGATDVRVIDGESASIQGLDRLGRRILLEKN